MMEGLFAIQYPRAASARVAMATAFTFAAVFLLVLGVSSYLRARVAVRRRAAATSFDGSASGAALAPDGLSKTPAPFDTRACRQPRRSWAMWSAARLAIRPRHRRSSASFCAPVSSAQVPSTGIRLCAPFCCWPADSSGYFGHGYLFSDAASQLGNNGGGCPGRDRFPGTEPLRHDAQEALGPGMPGGFPDFIDLMIVCAEAGLGPRAAIDRLSREIAKTYPILGAHLYLASVEIRAGSSLHQALFNLSRRTQVEEAATLASLLEQTEQLGTSVTDALRVYRDEMRERRVLRAEEKAHSLPAKLVLPLGIFVFPVLLIVILLPAIIRIQHVTH